jgi:DNA sulfur modification protein DndC
LIVDFTDKNLAAINHAAKAQSLPFESHKIVPELGETFWLNLLAKYSSDFQPPAHLG